MWLIDVVCSLPLWLLAIVLNLWLMGFATAVLWAARRWWLPRLQLAHHDAYFAAAVVQSAMVLYGLIAALTAVAVWQRHSSVADTISAEATVITSLWRDIGGYPQPLRDDAREVLRGYTEQIIEEAWPQQARGEIPSMGVQWMDRLQQRLFSFEPGKESERILHAEVVRTFNQLVQQRRNRLDAVQTALPGVFWCMLLPGAMACLALFVFFHVENVVYHAILLFGLAGFLSMVLFVIIALDRPFSGPVGIPPDSYVLIHAHHMKTG